MKRLSALFGKIIPQTRWVRDDGSFILSTQDIHRRRMVVVSFVITVLTSFYVGWQITELLAGRPALMNFGFGAIACLFSGFALRESLWGLSPEPYIRVLLLAFSVMLWTEIYQSGGVTGYHVGILPFLPVIAAVLLKARDTLFFTALNAVVVIGLAVSANGGFAIPDFEVDPRADTVLSAMMIIVSILGCGAASVMLVQQSEKVNRQLLDLVEYQSHLAAHDHLSGLGNRIRLQERFEQVSPGESFDLLLIDLDGFKAVNDTHGHNAGDYLLKTMSQRLREVTDEGDLLVRLGGDEFVIVLEQVEGTLGSVRKYAEYLIDIVSRPYHMDDTVLRVSASIGHARYPDHAATPSKVLSLADKALYQAKDAGKRQCITYGTRECPRTRGKGKPTAERPEAKRKIAAFTANLRQKSV